MNISIKSWFARNQDDVSKWNNMSIRGLHYKYPAKRVGFLQSGHHHRNNMAETNYSFAVKQ